MAMQVGGKGGVFVEMNVVPLIDILLVLLVIFMIIPHHQKGLDAMVPQPATSTTAPPPETVIVVQVQASGELRINQEPVAWDQLGNRLEAIFKQRASKVAFIRGEAPVEFAQVARVVDVMHGSGISVGLLTPGLVQSR
ncbi:MAG TPA: biopolymer transporter ExbD [Candidatus Acidoferrum sp.]|jgi:biopolymer transport protein TolR|nr:biopolymer transporter ExbD [Candidatus Acidoferrum sp.]